MTAVTGKYSNEYATVVLRKCSVNASQYKTVHKKKASLLIPPFFYTEEIGHCYVPSDVLNKNSKEKTLEEIKN